jgi:hypothetical protein
MWGTWGTAWRCRCGDLDFSPVELPDNGLRYVALVSQQPVTACPQCGRELPALGWSGHDRALDELGYVPVTHLGEPFEIPGNGLGLFSMRKHAWVGFNEHARGFGGEELYVHEKVRRAGGRVLCLPWLTWLHRFGRPAGPRYPRSHALKVRNYVLEFMELGWSLAPIHEHFVEGGLLSSAEWDRLVSNPIGYAQSAPAPARPASTRPLPPNGEHNLDTLFAWCAAVPRDLDQHAAKIRELAGQVLHVTAIVKRREWDVFLLAGLPDELVTYTSERDVLHDILHHVVKHTETSHTAPRRLKRYTVHQVADLATVQTIEPTELLVLDTVPDGERLYGDLVRFAESVGRWIMFRGTHSFAEHSEQAGGRGLNWAIERFTTDRPEWIVAYQTPDQYGLTVLERT